MEELIDKFNWMTKISKREKAWSAYWDGKKIKVDSGKSTWNSIGAAKNAVRNTIYYDLYNRAGFKSSAEACRFFENEGRLTYKQLD